MPRKKPFSQKAKREQLAARRARKRADAEREMEELEAAASLRAGEGGAGAGAGGGDGAGEGPSGTASVELTTSFGRHGELNEFSTVFAKEDPEVVWKRKVASQEPIELDRRHKPSCAPLPSIDPLLNHPRGLIDRGAGRADASATEFDEPDADAEVERFKAWLDAVYTNYDREHLNHFEHNIEVWRQLWRVTAAADVVVIVTDIRNPLYHIPRSLYDEVTVTLGKPLVVVLNKVDLVSQSHVDKWTAYLKAAFPGTLFVPFSACGADLTDMNRVAERRKELQKAIKSHHNPYVSRRQAFCRRLLNAVGADFAVDTIMTRLLEVGKKPGRGSDVRQRRNDAVDRYALPEDSRRSKKRGKNKGKGRHRRGRKFSDDMAAAEEEEEEEGEEGPEEDVPEDAEPSVPTPSTETTETKEGEDVAGDGAGAGAGAGAGDGVGSGGPGPRSTLSIAMVGHPNVGKSSIINTLCGEKRVSVSHTPGHTKRMQTIPLVDGLELLDCPGLVFPYSFVSNDGTAGTTSDAIDTIDRQRAMQECMGVLPLAQLREPYSAVRLLAEHLPLEAMYGLLLRSDEPEWTALNLCETYAEKRGYRIARTKGRPDAHRAGREIIGHCVDGWLPFAFLPPDVAEPSAGVVVSSSAGMGDDAASDSEDSEEGDE